MSLGAMALSDRLLRLLHTARGPAAAELVLVDLLCRGAGTCSAVLSEAQTRALHRAVERILDGPGGGLRAQCDAREQVLQYLPGLARRANLLTKSMFLLCGEQDAEEERTYLEKLRQAVARDGCLTRRWSRNDRTFGLDDLHVRTDAYCRPGPTVLMITDAVVCDHHGVCFRAADALAMARDLERRHPPPGGGTGPG